MWITLRNVVRRNKVKVPSVGYFDFGERGDNLCWVPDSVGKSLTKNNMKSFRPITLPDKTMIKEAEINQTEWDELHNPVIPAPVIEPEIIDPINPVEPMIDGQVEDIEISEDVEIPEEAILSWDEIKEMAKERGIKIYGKTREELETELNNPLNV